MRRVFIIRKDLHLTPGKLAAQVGHAAELFWLECFKSSLFHDTWDFDRKGCKVKKICIECDVDPEVWSDYINGIYTKTICEARNLNHLLKAKAIAEELGLKEGSDYGFINDKCLTELKPENEDGTTTVGMWFAPLADNTAHQISKKFPLYRGYLSVECPDKVTGHFGLTKEENSQRTEVEKIRRFQEICKQSEGGLQTFKE